MWLCWSRIGMLVLEVGILYGRIRWLKWRKMHRERFYCIEVHSARCRQTDDASQREGITNLTSVLR